MRDYDKKYVYPHPINVFLIGDLDMSIVRFCELTGFKQSTLSSWISRNRPVGQLPVDFILALHLVSNQSLENIINRLLQIEAQYFKNNASHGRHRKKEQLET